MQRVLGTATALLAWASPTLALRLHDGQENHIPHTPGTHLQNLAGESFDVNQPGDHVLLRVPPDSGSTLIRVSGYFGAAPEAPCAMHTALVTLKGDWLGNQTLRVSLVNGSLHVKVSSSSPAYAGPWRSIQNYTAAKDGHEAIPDTFTIVKELNNTGFAFYAGPATSTQRPVIRVKRGLRAGLDVFVSNLQALNLPKVGGLLGSYKHNKTLEALSHECEQVPEGMRKTVSAATVDHVEGSQAMQPTQLRNLVNEKFTMNRPGEFSLLRVPKDPAVPGLIMVKGNFVASTEAPCVVFLQRVTLMGTWFGNKTVRVSSINGTLGIKVSSTQPAFAGKLRSVKDYFELRDGPEALPDTAKITTLLHGPSFKFQLGPKKLSERANILVTQTQFGGLDIGISHMERTEQGWIGGLLGMEKHEKYESVGRPSAECKSRLPHVDVPKVKARVEPTPGAGSVITATWTA